MARQSAGEAGSGHGRRPLPFGSGAVVIKKKKEVQGGPHLLLLFFNFHSFFNSPMPRRVEP
jgi:hypothetical protein